MKYIKEFYKKTLERFTVNLSYDSDLVGIEINTIKPLADEINKFYPENPILGLLKRRPSQVNIGTLTFKDEKNINLVEIGQDFLSFTFNQYDKWDTELSKIIHVFKALTKSVEIPNITKIVLTYTDVFRIPTEKFEYNNFFTMPNFDNDFGWNVKFHDIYLGFVPTEENLESEKRKITFRLRSRGIQDIYYVFGLETVGSIDNFIITPDPNKLKDHLDQCHAQIEDHFINILTDHYRGIIGLEIEEYE
ncbi:MAG: TIGR04255 family protein [Promethearchaeota archaeon]